MNELHYPFAQDGEAKRLDLQGEFFRECTLALCRQANIGGSMRVLDIGCGTGAVTSLVASLLGGRGQVLGVDSNLVRIDAARNLCTHLPPHVARRISFQHCSIDDLKSRSKFDAIVGRMVLMYAPDATATIRRLSTLLKKDGIVVFQEPDHSNYCRTRPSSPTYLRWHRAIKKAAGTAWSFGNQLEACVRDAGFEVVSVSREFRVDGGTQSRVYEVLAGTIRGMAERMMDTGAIHDANEIPTDLAEQLRTEAVRKDLAVFTSQLVGVIGRPPRTP